MDEINSLPLCRLLVQFCSCTPGTYKTISNKSPCKLNSCSIEGIKFSGLKENNSYILFLKTNEQATGTEQRKIEINYGPLVRMCSDTGCENLCGLGTNCHRYIFQTIQSRCNKTLPIKPLRQIESCTSSFPYKGFPYSH